MKATELRIGNLLQGSSSVVTVTKIFNEDNVGIGSGDPYNVSSETPCLAPIPLTKEWLLKLGFKSIGYSGLIRYRSGDFEIGEYKREWFLVDREMQLTLLIKYVHRLQNLYFELEDEELTVTVKEQAIA